MKILKQESSYVNNSLPSADAYVAAGGLADAQSNRQTNNNRTERTPGMAAVSKPTQDGRMEGALPCLPSPPAYVEFSAEASQQIQTESNSENSGNVAYFCHWNSFVSLFKPDHPYFHDKQGSLVGFYQYVHKDANDGKKFLYPIMGKHCRTNPFKRYLSARSHTGRTMGQLRAMVEVNKLKDFRQLDLVITFPRDISEELATRGKAGTDCAWSMFRKLWAELSVIMGIEGELAGMVNLHIWKTENPLQPHFHFHVIILNYYRMGDGVDEKLVKLFGFGINKSYTNEANKTRTGPVALSDSQLEAVKKDWTKIVRNSCKRNKIKCNYLDGNVETDKMLNLYVDYVKLDQISKFIHKLNYQRRHWSEDYVRFTEKNPDCSNPPDWLESYSNTVRVFGFWKQLKVFGGDKDLEAEPKIDFNTGEELEYQEYLKGFTEIEDISLFCYDGWKGRPIINELDANDVAWLKNCFPPDLMDKYGDPGG